METAILPKILTKLGTYLEIMSFYGFCSDSVTTSKLLCSRMKELTVEWCNALSSYLRRKTLFIRDGNSENLNNFNKSNSSIRELTELCLILKETKKQDEEEFENLLGNNSSLKHKRKLYVPENYTFIEKINTIPFRINEILLNLFQLISPDTFESPVKYISQIIECNLEECLNVGPNKDYGKYAYCRCHYALDIVYIYASFGILNKLFKSSKLQAQNLCIQGETGALRPELSDVISANSQFIKNLEYFQIFYHGSNFEFISSLLSQRSNFEKLKLIEISFLYSELDLLLEYLAKDDINIKSFPKFERLILINQRFNTQINQHDSHVFDLTSLDVDLYNDSCYFASNLFKIALIKDYELEVHGK